MLVELKLVKRKLFIKDSGIEIGFVVNMFSDDSEDSDDSDDSDFCVEMLSRIVVIKIEIEN